MGTRSDSSLWFTYKPCLWFWYSSHVNLSEPDIETSETTVPVRVTRPGTFQPGHDPRRSPGGVRAKPVTQAALAHLTPERLRKVIDTQYRIATNEDHASCTAAATWLRDTVQGRPKPAEDGADTGAGFLAALLGGMSADTLSALAARLEARTVDVEVVEPRDPYIDSNRDLATESG